MAMVINTNMGAINANRTLEMTSRDQATAMERLTSGLRINKSADDAAGMAITNKMTSQIMGTDQAVRNANDGISFVQTQDGAMDEVVNMMQRMRELSVQALNGTYTAENRSQMDAEFQQLAAEVTRVGQTTTFNGVNIMNGSVAKVSLHVGWDKGANNRIEVSTFDVSALGGSLDARDVTTVANASAAISVIDAKLSDVNTIRAKWGALQNRLESTVSNLTNVNENMNAARSAIQDADFAKESAELARTQVLQQAGMSMLSQANQSGQNVLSLLR
ncbi:flagellin [Thiomicrorhabdus sp. zzn3]|uniref:flagellin N-terminal helical domain-containing protein n=1 Tax=Thiomicrorhabdus sp. zzn3 TaxID=3039775 RepID=UPI002436708C|nr:flagellin [Thiomicrorhabdus sp. zzn3]MDG6777622.1 flagellin [Thiomicrorhabdus sp. zzn3]